MHNVAKNPPLHASTYKESNKIKILHYINKKLNYLKNPLFLNILRKLSLYIYI